MLIKKAVASVMAVATFAAVFTACDKDRMGPSDTNGPDTSVQSEEGQGDPAAAKKFIVGFDQDFPPMGFVDSNNEYVGFDLDLAKEAASRMGMEFVAQPIAWDSKDMELESGNIDCIWNGFTISGREDKYTWSEAYMINDQVVVVKNDSDIKSLADLAGKTVAVQKDSSGLAALNDNADLKNSFGELVEMESYLNALMELEMGSIDAIVMDEIVARYEIQTSGKPFKVLDEAVASEEYGVGFLLGNEALRDQVQKVLEDMAADGTMAKISEKWFGTDVTIIGK
ncbi:MAG: amino acid ABC transporter substrate-binding protein [Clostridiales bacterium]|nr:amino acid ABC transporter substrate-binding protein [Clostridiales bacterium]